VPTLASMELFVVPNNQVRFCNIYKKFEDVHLRRARHQKQFSSSSICLRDYV